MPDKRNIGRIVGWALTGKPRRMFRGRRWVRAFFEAYKVAAGDMLVLGEPPRRGRRGWERCDCPMPALRTTRLGKMRLSDARVADVDLAMAGKHLAVIGHTLFRHDVTTHPDAS